MSDTLAESLPAHAPLGPSSAEGWMTCADYVNANRGLPDFTTEPAAEGTAAHAISDLCLSLGLDAADLIGMHTRIGDHLFDWEDDDAMLLQSGIDKIRAGIGETAFYGERRVDISAWTIPGQFGTLDRAYIYFDPLTDEWWVVIEDLKWGRGIAVSPVRNKQLMLYALGFWRAVALEILPDEANVRFRLIIDQPRHAGGGGVWETDLKALLDFGEQAREAAARTTIADAPRTASLKGCMWCRARRTRRGCDTFDAYMIDLLGLSWDDIDMGLMMSTEMTLPRDLTPERVAYLLQHEGSIKRWLEDMRERMLVDALAALPTGDMKAVNGNKLPDKWKDKGLKAVPVVQQHLGDFGFDKRLKSPKQIITAVEGDEDAIAAIAPLIEPGGNKAILVSIDDARPAIRSAQALLDEEAEAGNGD